VGVERLTAAGDPSAVAARVHALAPGAESVTETVREIVDDVRVHGDDALRRYVARFDRVKGDLRVDADELAGALDALDPAVRAGLEVGIANVRAVAEADLGADAEVTLPQG
jgi:histidinol dehydrogenase